MNDASVQTMQGSSASFPEIILLLVLICAGIGVTLALTKKAVFYNDYNDLGISLGAVAFPVLAFFIFTSFGLFDALTGILMTSILLGMTGIVFYRTYHANDGRILVVFVIVIAKLALSVLYIIHLADLTMGKKRQTRGRGWFVVIILTPLLLALVHTQEGRFFLTRAGRPSLRI